MLFQRFADRRYPKTTSGQVIMTKQTRIKEILKMPDNQE